jgi:hypothetical protein
MPDEKRDAPPWLAAASTLSFSDTVERLKKAMKAIEKDIKDNDGIYPYNKGRLSQAELLRRGSVDKSTLQGKAHNGKGGMREVVNRWLEKTISAMENGGKEVRKVITRRVDDANSTIQQLQFNCHLYKLEKEDAEREISKRDVTILELRAALKEASKLHVITVKKPKASNQKAD